MKFQHLNYFALKLKMPVCLFGLEVSLPSSELNLELVIQGDFPRAMIFDVRDNYTCPAKLGVGVGGGGVAACPPPPFS